MKRKRWQEPLVHSPMVPAWRDEFDLRLYVSCIHPRQYELQSPEEYVMAKQLLAAAVAFAVCHVGIYRAAIRTAPKGAVLKGVVTCMRAARRLGYAGYSTWYEQPQPAFAGCSPSAWFKERGEGELAELLHLKLHVETEDILAEVPLQDRPDASASSGGPEVVAGRKGQGDARCSCEHEGGLLVLPKVPGLGWEDEFDLEPYLFRWSPANYMLGSRRNYHLAQELFDAMAAEFTGWVTLYRTALVAAGQIAGAMEAAVRCAMKAVELGLHAYLEWFRSPQPEFGSRAPQRWFQENGLSELCSLLQGGGSRPCRSPSHDEL